MEIRFVLPQDLAIAPYADMAAVSHNQHGFTIDFAADSGTDEHGVVTAQVVSRVKVPPTVVFQIIKAISENLDNYEKRFGPIASS